MKNFNNYIENKQYQCAQKDKLYAGPATLKRIPKKPVTYGSPATYDDQESRSSSQTLVPQPLSNRKAKTPVQGSLGSQPPLKTGLKPSPVKSGKQSAKTMQATPKKQKQRQSSSNFEVSKTVETKIQQQVAAQNLSSNNVHGPQENLDFAEAMAGHSLTSAQKMMLHVGRARLSHMRREQPTSRQLTLQHAIDIIKEEWIGDIKKIEALDERHDEREDEHHLEKKCLVQGFVKIWHNEGKKALQSNRNRKIYLKASHVVEKVAQKQSNG